MSKIKAFFLVLIALSTTVSQKAGVTTALPENAPVILPIIMYHEIKLNKPGKDAILPWEFENDLKYLRQNGYTAVTVKELEDYVFHGRALPEKPVMLTFDDGYLNNYRYAYPLLKTYDMKIVLSILVKNTDDFTDFPDGNLDYAHVNWAQLNEMARSGRVEIQNHTYNMHRITKKRTGCVKGRNENEEKYRRLFEADLCLSQSRIFEMTGNIPTAFVYPYGRYNDLTDLILKQSGFIATFTCDYGINSITKDPESLYRLKRICRAHNERIDKVLSEGMKALQYSQRNAGRAASE